MICAECTEEFATGEWDPRPSECPACGRKPLLCGQYRFEEELHRVPQTVRFRATRLSDGAAVTVTELLYPPSDRSMIRMEAQRMERRAQQIYVGDVPQVLACVVMGGDDARISVYVLEGAEDRKSEGGPAVDQILRQQLDTLLPADFDGGIAIEEMARRVEESLRALVPRRPTEAPTQRAERGRRLVAFVSLAALLVAAAAGIVVLERAEEKVEAPSSPVGEESPDRGGADEVISDGRRVAEALERRAVETAESHVEEEEEREGSASEPAAEVAERPRTEEPVLPQQAQNRPTSLGPLRLGMSLEDAQQAVSGERTWRRRAAGRPMPDGSHWWVQTPLLGEEVRCQVYLCEDEGLCRLYCEKHVAYAPEDYGKVREALFAKFSDRYGTHTRYFERDGSHRVWWWTHPDAELRLRTDSTPVENIRADQGHATKRIHLESGFYQKWHEEN